MKEEGFGFRGNMHIFTHECRTSSLYFKENKLMKSNDEFRLNDEWMKRINRKLANITRMVQELTLRRMGQSNVWESSLNYIFHLWRKWNIKKKKSNII